MTEPRPDPAGPDTDAEDLPDIRNDEVIDDPAADPPATIAPD